MRIATNVTLSALIFLFSCADNVQAVKEMDKSTVPGDFYFEMEYGEPDCNCSTDRFDSRTAMFSRRYSGGDTTILVELSEQDIQKIYSSFLKYDFLKLPNRVEQDTILDKGVRITRILFFANGQLKPVECSYYANLPLTKEISKFQNIRQAITGILDSKPNYRSLKRSDLVGL